MKKAWFALAALAGVAVWSAAAEYADRHIRITEAIDCKATIEEIHDIERTNPLRARFTTELLGLSRLCVIREPSAAIASIEALFREGLSEDEIFRFADILLLNGYDTAAAPWVPAAIAVFYVWQRPFTTDWVVGPPLSTKLESRIIQTGRTLLSDDVGDIVAAIEFQLAQPQNAPMAEHLFIDRFLQRLRELGSHEQFFWRGHAAEWENRPHAFNRTAADSYRFGAVCSDDRAIKRLAELYRDGLTDDENGIVALEALRRRMGSDEASSGLARELAAKLGHHGTRILAQQDWRLESEDAARLCARLLRRNATEADRPEREK